MKLTRTPIASAVAIALMGVVVASHAQTAAPAKPATDNTLDTVTVTGIRGSLDKALSVKRNAASNVEVITAEDVGKMPDKNVADSLSRLPGVAISSSAAGSGGFDENDRVSLRGTAPALTQTTINGHNIATGDWFVLDQIGGAVGRTTSYSLLPSEIVGQVVVHKSPTADLIEGGVSGTVDVLTRHPLDFKRSFAFEGSVEAVHSSLAGKTDPGYSALINFKNEANTFGALIQLFDEKRSLRRDGQELLQWDTPVKAGSALAKTNPDLVGVWVPRLIGSTLFLQQRERKGGTIDLQLKPSDAVELEATYFRSRLDASNYNYNYMTDTTVASGTFGGGVAPDPGYTIKNGTLTSATWTNKGTAAAPLRYGVVDNIIREGAYAQTEFLDLRGKFRINDSFTIKGLVGKTKGYGVTPAQGVFEGDLNNSGVSYSLNGLGSPASVKFPNINTANFTGTPLDWVFGASPASTTDVENYGQIDAEYILDSGIVKAIKFGYRATKHDRSNLEVAQGPNWANTDVGGTSTNPAWNGTTYPGNFANDLGGNFPKNVWMLDPGILNAWGALHSNRDPSRTYYPDMFNVTEKTQAAYVSADLEGAAWSGNVGVRLVKTDDTSNGWAILPAQPPGGSLPEFPWGGFVQPTSSGVSTTYALPSVNLRFDVAPDWVARVGVSRTMTRPDFSALGGTVTLTDETHTGNGGNSQLKPTISNNLDVSLQWYFTKRGLAAVNLFYMSLQDYIGYGTSVGTFIDSRASQTAGKGVFAQYVVTSPINVGATVKGAEFALQMPLGNGFGVDGNVTLADSSQNFGSCPAVTLTTSSDPCAMLGASKTTANGGIFYENDTFNVRVGYSWRSAYLAALDRGTPLYQDAVGTLSASFNYSVNKNLVLTFSGMNLNNPILKNYVFNPDQPARFYANGAQYYLGLRLKY